MLGGFKQIKSAKDMLEDMLAQIGKFRVLFCSITGKFLKVCGGTGIDRSSLVWGARVSSSLLCWALNVGFSLGCNTSSYQPAPRLSLVSPATLSEHDC